MPKHENIMAKGTLYLMLAHVIFLGCGYVVHFGITRFIDPIEYGRFGVILSILMITQIFLNMGIPEAVSKFISEGREPELVKKKALQLQLVFSILIFLIVFLISPLIADLLNDAQLANYIKFASFIIPINAIFSLYRGVLNGFRRFIKTASVITINAGFKVIFVFVFIILGYGLYGVIGGYISGAFIALWFGYVFSRNSKEGTNIKLKEILSFSFPMIGFAACYTAIMNFDILFTKALVANQNITGYYTAARALASIVFGVAIVLSITLLPSISKSFAKKDFVQIKNYISYSLRYFLIIFLPISILISISSKSIIDLFFPSEYVYASTALSILIIGVIFISIFVVLGSIINGIGKPKLSFNLGFFLLILSLILFYVLIDKYGIIGSSLSILIVGIVGSIIFSIVILKEFHVLINRKSLLKILLSLITGVIFLKLVNSIFIINKFNLIPISLIFFGLYFLILILLKEVKRKEIYYLKKMLLTK